MLPKVNDYPTANGAPEKPTFFCPFTAVYVSLSPGTGTIKLAPCDIKKCALGHGSTDLCSILHICNMLDQLGGCVLQLRPALEKIAEALAPSDPEAPHPAKLE